MSESGFAVTVCLSRAARQSDEIEVVVPAGSTVADAIRQSALLQSMPDDEVDALQTGIWGRKVAPNQPLRPNDRVELYRALTVDPKVARRERFTRQGARTAGLFSKRRAGAKSGY